MRNLLKIAVICKLWAEEHLGNIEEENQQRIPDFFLNFRLNLKGAFVLNLALNFLQNFLVESLVDLLVFLLYFQEQFLDKLPADQSLSYIIRLGSAGVLNVNRVADEVLGVGATAERRLPVNQVAAEVD